MSEQPTEAQRKEFWGWCGVPTYVRLLEGKWVDILPINLNNLFKYAVPKVQMEGCVVNLDSNPNLKYSCQVLPRRTSQATYAESKNPALALFWALWQVKEKSNE